MKTNKILAGLMLFFLVACSRNFDTIPQASRAQAEIAQAVSPADAVTKAQPSTSRLVIKSASLSLRVNDVRKTEESIRAKVAAMGGFVVNVQNNGSGQDLSTNMSFRVPSQKFDAALKDLETMSLDVLNRNISGQDVTEEFVDLDSRLGNLRATRERLLGFLAKATKVADALSVNEALSNIQGEIDQIVGRQKFIKQNVALSNIDVSLVPVAAIVPDGSWQPLLVARQALAGLLAFGRGLLSAIITLLIWSPVWLAALWLARAVLLRLAGPGRA